MLDVSSESAVMQNTSRLPAVGVSVTVIVVALAALSLAFCWTNA